MRGDIVFRIYGQHHGREKDTYFGAFRTRAEAEAAVAELATREMQGRNWAARYHDRGFCIQEHVVTTDFEIPSRPTPRQKYVVTEDDSSAPDTRGRTRVLVLRRGEDSELARVCEYERDYPLLQTFEPFRQGARELALISREYTKTAALDLSTGEVIAEEVEASPGAGFCPIGFYVPDWWDVHDGSVIPGSEHWSSDLEWPRGDLGFVWGCYWGDDTSWKVQVLDLSRVQEGIITRDERFGYVALATSTYVSPCLRPPTERPPMDARSLSGRPDFIHVSRWNGKTSVRLAVELTFDLASGRVDAQQYGSIASGEQPSGQG